jgi:hypothetical protein
LKADDGVETLQSQGFKRDCAFGCFTKLQAAISLDTKQIYKTLPSTNLLSISAL